MTIGLQQMDVVYVVRELVQWLKIHTLIFLSELYIYTYFKLYVQSSLVVCSNAVCF